MTDEANNMNGRDKKKPARGFWSLRLALLIVAILASIIVSYSVMQFLVRHHINAARPDQELVNVGRLARAHANTLGRLLDALRTETLQDSGVVRTGAAAHVKNVYQPRLRALRASMTAEETMSTGPGRELLAAVERALAMTAHFGDQTLRDHAFKQAASAIIAVETFIQQHQLENFLPEKAYLPDFTQEI